MYRSGFERIALVFVLLFALMSGAGAIGAGHRDSEDCPHCEMLVASRRRQASEVAVSVQARSNLLLTESAEARAGVFSRLSSETAQIAILDAPIVWQSIPIHSSSPVLPGMPSRLILRSATTQAARAPPFTF